MTAARDELKRLVEQLPEDQLSAALVEVQRLGVPSVVNAWPSPWFGALSTNNNALSVRVDAALADGFGR